MRVEMQATRAERVDADEDAREKTAARSEMRERLGFASRAGGERRRTPAPGAAARGGERGLRCARASACSSNEGRRAATS